MLLTKKLFFIFYSTHDKFTLLCTSSTMKLISAEQAKESSRVTRKPESPPAIFFMQGKLQISFGGTQSVNGVGWINNNEQQRKQQYDGQSTLESARSGLLIFIRWPLLPLPGGERSGRIGCHFMNCTCILESEEKKRNRRRSHWITGEYRQLKLSEWLLQSLFLCVCQVISEIYVRGLQIMCTMTLHQSTLVHPSPTNWPF